MIDSVIHYIRNSQDEALGELKELIQFPSVAATGEHLAETAGLVRRMLDTAGFKTRIHETSGAPVVTGEINVGARRTLLFYDHYDVQPPDPLALWHTPPFNPTIREGRLYGRGAADNKGDLLSRIWVLRAFKAAGKKPPVNVRFVVEGEEEISSPHLQEFTSKNPKFLTADGGIWEFGGAGIDEKQELWLGLKGILYVQLEVERLSHDAHSSLACVLPSAAYRLVWALSTLKDESEHVLIDGFYDKVRPLSIAELAVLSTIDFNEERVREFYGIERFVLGLEADRLKEAYYNAPTCNICGLDSGYKEAGSKTVLPAKAVAKVDFRLVRDMDPEKVLASLRRHLDSKGFGDVKIAWHEGYPAAKTPIDHPFVGMVLRASQKAFGHDPVIQITSPGSGPLHLFKDFVPMVSTGCGDFTSRVHSPNESIRLDLFEKTMERIAYLMDEMSRW